VKREKSKGTAAKFAIVGTGFGGLAAGWYLLQQFASVDFYDPLPIGFGTSGLAAGLLHPYAGLHAKLNWKGYEGFAAAKELLQVASSVLKEPVFWESGLLRLALTEENKSDFAKCAQKFPSVKWWTEEECQNKVAGIVKAPGIFIEEALTVDTKKYLQGLKQSCFQQGARFFCQAISNLNDLKEYDGIILAAGAATSQWAETAQLPLSKLKGQILELEWPADLPPLSIPLNSQAYIVMNPSSKNCIVGATFERDFNDESPNPQLAIEDLLPKAIDMLPALKKAKVISCRSGIRASAPLHRPLVQQINPRCWVFTGMGSKGLLYHALYAKELIEKMKQITMQL